MRCWVNNGLACFWYIDFEDLLAVNALQAGLLAECCDEPAVSVSGRKEQLETVVAHHTVATPYLRDVKTAGISICCCMREPPGHVVKLTFVTVEHGGDG